MAKKRKTTRKKQPARKEGKDSGFGEMYSSDVVRTAYIDGNTFYATPVQYAEVDGLAMFEGDIILGIATEVERISDMHQKEMRGEIAHGVVITGSQYRWPNCTVPYTIDSSLPNQARVTGAIAHWEANTCFRFVLRTAGNASQYPDWINFQPSTGCSSYVGRRGGQQPINLASGCTLGNTIHEMGHAIGLWHEQSRADRDSFITIHWDKIQPGREHNFNQHITDGDDVGAYDYGSLMHYGRTAFSIDGSDTITPTNPPTAVIGQRNGLSPGDIAAANSLCPRPICPPGPIICPPAPRICPPAPRFCPPAPRFCPPAPRFCPPAPRLCPPAPRFCPPAPRFACPPAPRIIGCPPAPRIIGCPPAPRIIGCPPAPIGGCLAGPYKRPGFEIGPFDYGYDPYGYGETGEDWAAQGYADPYGYGQAGEDWTAYEYADPYAGYQPQACCEPQGPFDPRYGM